MSGLTPDQQKVSMEMVRKYRVILDSMTGEELDEPHIIKGSRIDRVARGSGVGTNDVKDMLKRYEVLRKQVSALRSNRRVRKQIMEMLGKEGSFDFDELERGGGRGGR